MRSNPTPHSCGILAAAFLSVAALAGCQGALDLEDPNNAMKPAPGLNNTVVLPENKPPIEERKPPKTPFAPGEATMPRITAQQYANILEDVFGPGMPAEQLEPDTNPYLFYSIGASSTEVSSFGVERYDQSARSVAQTLFADPMRRDAVLGCQPQTADDACGRKFIETIGAKLFRRPLTADEIIRYQSLALDIGQGDALLGLQWALAGMLQSPKFLYRMEYGQADPANPERKLYTQHEMASRLAFLFWNSGPDEQLMQAAEEGKLHDEAELRAQAERMLDDPRARRAVQDFFAQYLDLKRLDDVERDPTRYPGYSPTLLEAMRTEVKLLVDDIVFRRDDDIRTLLSARRSFVNSELAELYDIEAPGATPYAFVPVEFDADSPRAGVLTLSAFLTMNAHPTETSPTLRGKYLRERLFCQTVPPPPDDIDLNLEPEAGEEPRTLRERLEQHREDPACFGCHSFIDPPGYLFENFDSVGRYREQVEGHAVDAAGNLNGTELANATELAGMLRADEQMPGCLVKQLYRHAQGRLEAESEERALFDLELTFAMQGYRFQTLMIELAASEAFRSLQDAQDTNAGDN